MTANNMFISIIVDGAKLPIVLDTKKATIFAQELDRAGKKWRIGSIL
jgi:hypothetical protein